MGMTSDGLSYWQAESEGINLLVLWEAKTPAERRRQKEGAR